VAIARDGLKARARFDARGNDESVYLYALDRTVERGQAPADILIESWRNEWQGSFKPLFRDYAY